ncbi:MAG: hypothetical protein SH809_12680 [Rhodothermales bacterium]|nr:hypothetical protein [Rhodothermales bacterium]
MTPEEFERIKRAEKEHLLALKKLKEQLRAAQRMQTINRALKEMQDAPGVDISRTHDEMIERLALDTVRQEVKLDMALSETPIEPEDTEEARQARAAAEAELEKLRASSLINQIKIEMGLPPAGQKQDPSSNVAPSRTNRGATEHPARSTSGSDTDSSTESDTASTPKSGPEKTIGRFRR